MTGTTTRRPSAAEPATATARLGKPEPSGLVPVMLQDWRDLLFLHWLLGGSSTGCRTWRRRWRWGGGKASRWSASRRGGRTRGAWRPGPGPAEPSAPSSLEEFLIERYVLFAESGGHLVRARVLHEDYPVVDATLLELDDELVRAAGFAVEGRAAGPRLAGGGRAGVGAGGYCFLRDRSLRAE